MSSPLDTFALPMASAPRDGPLAHHRGTLSTVENVESGARGGFHVSLEAEAARDGRTTAFGRVVSGLRVRTPWPLSGSLSHIRTHSHTNTYKYVWTHLG